MSDPLSFQLDDTLPEDLQQISELIEKAAIARADDCVCAAVPAAAFRAAAIEKFERRPFETPYPRVAIACTACCEILKSTVDGPISTE